MHTTVQERWNDLYRASIAARPGLANNAFNPDVWAAKVLDRQYRDKARSARRRAAQLRREADALVAKGRAARAARSYAQGDLLIAEGRLRRADAQRDELQAQTWITTLAQRKVRRAQLDKEKATCERAFVAAVIEAYGVAAGIKRRYATVIVKGDRYDAKVTVANAALTETTEH